MTTALTYDQLAATLDAVGLTYAPLDLGAARLLITQRGGRVFGPFFGEAPGLFWMQPALAETERLVAFLRQRETGWNLGGERLWIAPEIQFTIRDRADFWGSYHMPSAMDPGKYALQAAQGVVRLAQQMTLDAYNLASGQTQLVAGVTLRPLPDPLRRVVDYAALVDGVQYAGYARVVRLAHAVPTTIMSGAWVLVQVNAGGTLIVPARPGAEVTTYMGDPVPAALTPADGAFRVPMTGDRQFKTGYRAAYLTGRLGYLHPGTGADDAYLLVRGFDNDPSSIYPEEPPDQPGVNGDSVHLYNDDGGMGGFAELECQGRTLGGEAGLTEAVDTFSLWCYVGPLAKLEQIAARLL